MHSRASLPCTSSLSRDCLNRGNSPDCANLPFEFFLASQCSVFLGGFLSWFPAAPELIFIDHKDLAPNTSPRGNMSHDQPQ